MAELRNKPQVAAAGPDFPETQMERKGAKKRKKEAKDKNVETYSQPKAKKRNQVEQPLGDPHWVKDSAASPEVGEDGVWPLDDRDLPPKLKKRRENKKLQKQVEAAVDAMLDETPLKKKKKKKKGSK